jgi:hypothetical protein
MKGSMGFWVLVGIGLAGAAAALALKVLPARSRLNDRIGELESARAELMERTARPIATDASVEDRKGALDVLDDARRRIGEYLESTERSVLRGWFPELGIAPFAKEIPDVQRFRQLYLLGQDRLVEDVREKLLLLGIRESGRCFNEHLWMKGDVTPDLGTLTFTQETFWLEDRIMRSLADNGAWLVEPVQIEPAWRERLGQDPFEERKIDVTARVLPAKAMSAAESLVVGAKDGASEGQQDRLLSFIDRMSVGRDPKAQALEGGASEPPVLLSVSLTLIRYRPSR